MKNLLDEELYKTSDLSLAVTLSLFFPILGIEKMNPNRAYFLFEHTDELQNTTKKYWNGELKIEPKSYSIQLRQLRTRVYEESLK